MSKNIYGASKYFALFKFLETFFTPSVLKYNRCNEEAYS